MTFENVRRIGVELPRVEAGTAYGSPALTIGGRMFACIAIHKSAEPDTLAVRVPEADRDELMAAAPATYYLTDHYRDYSTVLVRLSRVGPDELRDLLKMSYEFVKRTSKPARRPGSRVRSRSRTRR